MLSQYDGGENILASERIGAGGFVSKRATSSELVKEVRAIDYLGKPLQRPAEC